MLLKYRNELDLLRYCQPLVNTQKYSAIMSAGVGLGCFIMFVAFCTVIILNIKEKFATITDLSGPAQSNMACIFYMANT